MNFGSVFNFNANSFTGFQRTVKLVSFAHIDGV